MLTTIGATATQAIERATADSVPLHLWCSDQVGITTDLMIPRSSSLSISSLRDCETSVNTRELRSNHSVQHPDCQC
jgi:hypothetical protein